MVSCILSCIEFDREVNLPQPSSEYKVSKLYVKHGYRPTGNVFTHKASIRYSDYFMRIITELKQVVAASKSYGGVYADNDISKITSRLEKVDFACLRGTYLDSNYHSLNEIVIIEFNDIKYSISEFNSLTTIDRRFSTEPIRFYLTSPPLKTDDFQFEATLEIDGNPYKVTSDFIELFP